jgi:hypothetical protein
MGHKGMSFATRCARSIKIGQGVGSCTRTVSVTVRDAAGYTTALPDLRLKIYDLRARVS